jgi:glycosyltransferase involved in cell wall biosynthesis
VNIIKTTARRLLIPTAAKAAVKRPQLNRHREPSVSVVIPCYNYGHYLPACVESVLSQQGVRLDVHIIDDASADRSAQIAQRIAAKDSRVRATCHTTNQGHIATFNEGMALARGDYTVLLSADDLLTEGCLARATSLMEQHPSVGMTYGFTVEFGDGSLPRARTVATDWIIWQGHSWISHICNIGRNITLSPELVFRTEILREVGYFRPDLPHSGDLEICMRVATVSDIGYVAGADQAYYRIHAENMHHSFDRVADMSERLHTFDVLFDERSAFLPNSAALREAAHRALAREALGHAVSAYTRGATGQEPVDGYAEFALRAWPEVKRLGAWKVVSAISCESHSRRAPGLSLTIRESARNVSYSLRWWRRRWVGG